MLMEQEPESDFSFCLGADTFVDLTAWKWRRSRDVLRLLGGRLVVLHRKGTNGDLLRGRVESVNQTESANVALLDVPHLEEVSSSLVRSCCEGDKLASMVSSGVLSYMKTNGLYAFMDQGRNMSPQLFQERAGS
jgi:nicotinic acid mononucleotide adenylyltransferase